MNVPKSFWGETILTATYLTNRLPSRIVNYSNPIETLSRFFPNFDGFNHLSPRMFGCVAFVHIYALQGTEFDPCVLKCIFFGYSPTKKGYKCYHPASKRFFVTMDVSFNEKATFFFFLILIFKGSLSQKIRNSFLTYLFFLS